MLGLLLNDGLCVKAIWWDCTSGYFNLHWPHMVCLLNLSSNFNEMFVQVFGRIRYGGHHRLACGTSHWRLLELDKETKCGLQRWDLIISKLELPTTYSNLLSWPEVTGCDPSQLPTRKGINLEKLRGGNSFKFSCSDLSQRLVQQEPPYHQASCK